MDTYLSSVSADYNYTLVLRNQEVMPETGKKTQKIHKFDDGGITVTRLSDSSFFDVQIQFDVLSATDADILFDLYHDTTKANGSARTFYWQHPATLKYYTVRLMSEIPKEYKGGWSSTYLAVKPITLRIEGNKPT